MQVRARIPVRIDFGGPWTDTPEFYENEPMGGATLNAAIVPLRNNVNSEPVKLYVVGESDTGVSFSQSDQPRGSSCQARGLSVTYTAGTPTSGLGTSAALNALWLGLIKGVNENLRSHKARELIAEKSHRIERELGIIGGKQDQYAAVFGGINLFIFRQDGRVDKRAVPLEPDQVMTLQQSLILFDTGRTRLSSTLHEHVWGNYRAGTNRDALVRMREIAFDMLSTLTASDWVGFGSLLCQNWLCQKALHPSITNEQIEKIFDILKYVTGFLGGKACGAGGGGSLLFLVEPEERDRFVRILNNLEGEVIPFEFDDQGLVVERKEE